MQLNGGAISLWPVPDDIAEFVEEALDEEMDTSSEEYEEMHYDGIQFEDSDRMFDLCMHFVDGKVWVDVYECDWEGDNWYTNCRHSWTLTGGEHE